MVDILLATYNGAQFIEEQIQSILNQTYTCWNLIIRDDGSTDRTIEIIKAIMIEHVNKITLIEDGDRSGSAKNNFYILLEHSKNAYVMFCDQDDVWLPYKIERSLVAMQQEENKKINLPILIHSDLTVVSEQGEVINNSLYSMQNIDVFYFDRIERLLVQNAVTGCTMMMNRTLADRILAMPAEAIMHDWWIALHAMVFGEIIYLQEPQILYRQHSSNAVGAKNTRSFAYIVRQMQNLSVMKQNIKQTYHQAEALYNCLTELDLQFDDLIKIKRYGKLTKANKFVRVYTLARFGYLKNSFIRRLGQLFLC